MKMNKYRCLLKKILSNFEKSSEIVSEFQKLVWTSKEDLPVCLHELAYDFDFYDFDAVTKKSEDEHKKEMLKKEIEQIIKTLDVFD